MYPHHDNVDFAGDFSIPEEDVRKVKFQQIGEKAAGIYLAAKRQAKSSLLAFQNGIKSTISTEVNNEIVVALQKQKKQLGKRYLIWAVIASVTSFVLGNICMFIIT